MRAPASLRVYRWLYDIAIRVPAGHLAELWQDVRYGVRMLAASPDGRLTEPWLASLEVGWSSVPHRPTRTGRRWVRWETPPEFFNEVTRTPHSSYNERLPLRCLSPPN